MALPSLFHGRLREPGGFPYPLGADGRGVSCAHLGEAWHNRGPGLRTRRTVRWRIRNR